MDHSEELFRFQKWHVFDQICIILPIAARADFQLWRALTALWKVKSDWNEWKLSIMVRGIQIMWKFWILTFSARYARADMYGRKILKCSKRPETCSPLFRKWFWAILNFDARAHARIWESPDMDRPVCWHMAWSLWALNMADLGWMVMKIWMITWIHKMAPRWRHGWVIRLKSFSRFLIMAKILENF